MPAKRSSNKKPYWMYLFIDVGGNVYNAYQDVYDTTTPREWHLFSMQKAG